MHIIGNHLGDVNAFAKVLVLVRGLAGLDPSATRRPNPRFNNTCSTRFHSLAPFILCAYIYCIVLYWGSDTVKEVRLQCSVCGPLVFSMAVKHLTLKDTEGRLLTSDYVLVSVIVKVPV